MFPLQYRYSTMLRMLIDAERQALLTFIGAALIKLASGIIAIWGTVNIYFFSYLKHQGTHITSMTNSIILLCTVIPSAFAMLGSTTLSRIFGYQLVVKVCGFFFALTPLLINLKINTFILGFCYVFVPVSCMSISSIPVLNCLWSQFPGHLNKVSGAAVVFFSAGSIIFNLIFAFIVNPNNEKATISPQGQAFFSEQIASHIFKASNIIFLISGTFFITGSFLISKKENVQSSLESRRNSELAEESPPGDQASIHADQCSVPAAQKTQTLKETLLDKKFLILFGISYIVPLYIIYLNLYMKLIFMPIINDDHFLASCAIVVTLSAIIGAPFWGYMGDSIGFKKTLLIILISDILCKIFGIFCSEKWNIIMLYSMLSFNDKGILTIIGPGLIEMFGLEMATELIPYKGLSIFLAFITVPAFQLIFSSFLHFRLILVVFLLFTGVALVMTLYFYFKIEYVKRVEPEEGDQKHRFQEKDVDNYLP